MTINLNKYAQGIISVQLNLNYEGKNTHVLIMDPRRREGYSWIGGLFRPSGDLISSAEELVKFQTGAEVEKDSLKLKRIVYSRTSVNHRYIANYTFFGNALPLEQWNPPQNQEFHTALFETESLATTPKRVSNLHGKSPNGKFEWAINDGGFIAKMAACTYQHIREEGIEAFRDIPVINVPYEGKSRMPPGVGLNVGSVIIPHTYKGKRGRVVIKNTDSYKYANIGGKVEVLNDEHSANVDIHSCIMQEASEEIGVNLHATSIVGSASTPLDKVVNDPEVTTGDFTSILNTCIRARPVNPKQLDDAIAHPERYIPESERDQIKGIYFLDNENYISLLTKGKMRTPDMVPLARQEFYNPPSQRPSLESIVVLKEEDFSAKFRKMITHPDGTLRTETTILS